MAERRRGASGSPVEPAIGVSRAIRAGDRVLVSGTGPVGADDADPATQMRRCIEIAEQGLRELDAALDDVIRTRVYLTDAQHWEAVGRVHSEAFARRDRPPRWSWSRRCSILAGLSRS